MTSSSRPRIFIGSSVEGLPVAEALQLGLDHDAETTLWSQGVFGLSHGTLEDLVRASREFDFAVLVLTPDDLTIRRGTTGNSPRDNVIFELGLFMGALGRARTFIVYCRDTKPELPSDLAGVTPATYASRADGNVQAALGAACTQIKRAISEVNAHSSSAHEIEKRLAHTEKLLESSERSREVLEQRLLPRILTDAQCDQLSASLRNAAVHGAATVPIIVGSRFMDQESNNLGTQIHATIQSAGWETVHTPLSTHSIPGIAVYLNSPDQTLTVLDAVRKAFEVAGIAFSTNCLSVTQVPIQHAPAIYVIVGFKP